MKKLLLSLAIVAFFSFSLSAQVSSGESNKTIQSLEQQKIENAKKVEQQKLERQKQEKQRLANQQTKNPQANNPNAPVATFDKMVHDYGTIEQHADGNCEFTFTNTGKEPLILSNVRAS